MLEGYGELIASRSHNDEIARKLQSLWTRCWLCLHHSRRSSQPMAQASSPNTPLSFASYATSCSPLSLPLPLAPDSLLSASIDTHAPLRDLYIDEIQVVNETPLSSPPMSPEIYLRTGPPTPEEEREAAVTLSQLACDEDLDELSDASSTETVSVSSVDPSHYINSPSVVSRNRRRVLESVFGFEHRTYTTERLRNDPGMYMYVHAKLAAELYGIAEKLGYANDPDDTFAAFVHHAYHGRECFLNELERKLRNLIELHYLHCFGCVGQREYFVYEPGCRLPFMREAQHNLSPFAKWHYATDRNCRTCLEVDHTGAFKHQ